jgi:hypothetical protein
VLLLMSTCEEKNKMFATQKETCMKDVEWLFGVLQSRCAIVRPGAKSVLPVRWASDRQGPLGYVHVTLVARLVSNKKKRIGPFASTCTQMQLNFIVNRERKKEQLH